MAMLPLLIASCEFSPEDVNFVHIDDTPKNSLSISLNESPDTIIVVEPITFVLDVEKGIADADVEVWVKLEGHDEYWPMEQDPEHPGRYSFAFNPYFETSGFRKLTIEANTSTRTGSMADKLGLERVYAVAEKVLQFDNSEPAAIPITAVTEEDGSIVLHWDEYPHLNLKSITVLQLREDGATPINGFVVPPGRTWYKDSSFAGGSIKYSLTVENTRSEFITGPVYAFTGKPLPKIRSSKTVGGTSSVDVKWNKVGYPYNFKSYRVVEQLTQSTLYTTTDVNDTTFQCQMILGAPKRLSIITETYGLTTGDGSTVVQLGEKMAVTNYDRLFFSQNVDRIHYASRFWFGVLNNNVRTDSTSIEYGFNSPFVVTLPHDGSSAFTTSLNLYEFDGPTASYKKNQFNYFCMNPQVTNDRLLIYNLNALPNCYPNENMAPAITLHDYAANATLDTLISYPDKESAPKVEFTEIGFNERQILIKNQFEFRVATFDNTGFLTDKPIPIPSSFEAHFLPGDVDKVYGFSNTQIRIHSIASGVTSSIPMPELLLFPEIDQVSGWIGGLNEAWTHYVVVDVRTGQKVKQIALAPSSAWSYSDPATFYLWDKKLYMKPGLMLDLE